MSAEIFVVEFLRKDGKRRKRLEYGPFAWRKRKMAQDSTKAYACPTRVARFVEADDTPCVWRYGRGSFAWWTGECGWKFHGNPRDMHYCPKCGRKIKEAPDA